MIKPYRIVRNQTESCIEPGQCCLLVSSLDDVVLFCYPQTRARRVSAIMTAPSARARRCGPHTVLLLVSRRPTLGSHWSLLAGGPALLAGPAFFVRILAATGVRAPGLFCPPDKFGRKMT